MSFPPPITGLKLHVSTGVSPNVQTFEQTISFANMGSNSVPIHNTSLTSAFNNQPPGTIFNPSIVTTYSEFPSGDTLSTLSVLNFVPRKITPTLFLGNIPNTVISTDESFSLSVTTNSTGVLSYESSALGVATVNSSGVVTPVGAGTTNISVSQAASTNGVYAATSISQQLIISAPEPSIATLAYYPFDSDGNDASTNNNNLINHNTVIFDSVNKKRGSGAALFNGSNYFEIANDGRFSPDNFTVACWLRPLSSVGNYQAVASCRNGTVPNVNGWMIYIHPDNSLQFWTGAGVGSSGWSGSGNTLYPGFGNLNRWVHLAFTFTKSTGSLKLFIDGALYSTVARSYTNTTINNLRIGAGANESFAQIFLINGTLLDDFRFYNSVLTASQVSGIYSN